jgi:Reverse transcriptase (RNA-dependent DNA polymerase)
MEETSSEEYDDDIRTADTAGTESIRKQRTGVVYSLIPTTKNLKKLQIRKFLNYKRKRYFHLCQQTPRKASSPYHLGLQIQVWQWRIFDKIQSLPMCMRKYSETKLTWHLCSYISSQGITSVFDLETLQLDVQNAFVHSTLDEEVYYENPGLNTGNCVRLQKALYGLRRAPRLWQQNLTKKLCELNLRQIAEEPCDFMPMTTKPLTQNPAQASPQNIHLFQQKVGSLLYATTITRPDVARTANKLSEFMNNPSPEHFVAVDRAISYLYGTKSLAIGYSRDSDAFLCASDAAFADNVDRKSTEGFIFKLFGRPIDWRSSKQKTITTSTTEAGLLALSHTTKEFYWWKRLFKDIGLDLEDKGTTPVLCDNQQTVGLLQKEQPIFKT